MFLNTSFKKRILFQSKPCHKFSNLVIERFASAQALNLAFRLSNFICAVTLYPLEGFSEFVHLFVDPIFVVWHKGLLHLFHKAESDQFSISQALVREDIGSEGSINSGLWWLCSLAKCWCQKHSKTSLAQLNMGSKVRLEL